MNARFSSMSWFTGGLIVLGLVSIPLFVVFRGMVQNRWMLQDTPSELAHGGAVFAVVFVPLAATLLWLTRSHGGGVPWAALGGWALCSALSGWYGGPVVLNLRNHASDVPGQAVELAAVKHLKQAMSVRILGEAYQGITFTCEAGTWRKHYSEARRTAPGLVFRGRLGLLWVEFREK